MAAIAQENLRFSMILFPDFRSFASTFTEKVTETQPYPSLIDTGPKPQCSAAKKAIAPPKPGMIPNPNKPAHWSKVNDVQKDHWNRRNMIPEPDWTTMSPNQRKKWFHPK
jgi:hypothetical protein